MLNIGRTRMRMKIRMEMEKLGEGESQGMSGRFVFSIRHVLKNRMTPIRPKDCTFDGHLLVIRILRNIINTHLADMFDSVGRNKVIKGERAVTEKIAHLKDCCRALLLMAQYEEKRTKTLIQVVRVPSLLLYLLRPAFNGSNDLGKFPPKSGPSALPQPGHGKRRRRRNSLLSPFLLV